jgi:hypothetical protein
MDRFSNFKMFFVGVDDGVKFFKLAGMLREVVK